MELKILELGGTGEGGVFFFSSFFFLLACNAFFFFAGWMGWLDVGLKSHCEIAVVLIR